MLNSSFEVRSKLNFFFANHCRTGWFAVIGIVVTLALVGVPRFVFGFLVPEVPLCRTSNEFYNESVTILGVPALVLVAVMTARLICAVNTKRFTSGTQLAEYKMVLKFSGFFKK